MPPLCVLESWLWREPDAMRFLILQIREEILLNYQLELTFRHMDFSGVCFLFEEGKLSELPLSESEQSLKLFKH